jgi:acyl-CoA thioester hydrolase
VSTVFEHPVSIRWRDIDGLGHVNHAIFMTYLEEGRDRFYQQVLGDLGYVMVRLEIDFRAEIRLEPRHVTVRIAAERLGTTSLTTRESVLTAAGVTAAEARVVTVRWDEENRKATPFSPAERERITALLGSG